MFLLNGKPTDNISLLDRGLHYGDGVFETIAVFQEQALCLEQHLQRLMSGCARLKINFNDFELLKSEISGVCKNVDRAVLKITITSNSGGRGYQRPDANITPTRILAIHDWPENNSSESINVRLCTTRLAHQPALAGIKHLNRLEQVLARDEWQDSDFTEGLMLDFDDNVIEGTMSNVFAVYPDRKLRTPDLALCGIAGIVRQYLLEHATDIAYTAEVCKLSLADITSADEVFFCNSIAGILPVKQLGKTIFTSQSAANEIKQFLQSREVITPS